MGTDGNAISVRGAPLGDPIRRGSRPFAEEHGPPFGELTPLPEPAGFASPAGSRGHPGAVPLPPVGALRIASRVGADIYHNRSYRKYQPMNERRSHAGPRPEDSALLSAADSASTALAAPVPAAATEPGAPAALYLASLTDGPGRKGMQRALAIATHVFSDGKTSDWTTLPWAHIRYRHLEALRTRLREHYAPATVNLVLSAVRGVLRAAFADGTISAADYLRIKMVKGVEAHRQPCGRSLDAGEARALFRACTAERTSAGTRDAAAFALMYGAGLRRAEAAALDLADYNRETGALRVIGKGDKERTAYLGKGGMDALDDWLEIRGDDSGPFLVPVDHVGRLTVRRMTPQALMYRLRRRSKQAGIAPCSPHDLRRSFVSSLLDAGLDLATVQKLVGHASPDTTVRYDLRGEEVARRGAALHHIPYRRLAG